MSKGRRPYKKCTDTAPGRLRLGQTLARRSGLASSAEVVSLMQNPRQRHMIPARNPKQLFIGLGEFWELCGPRGDLGGQKWL